LEPTPWLVGRGTRLADRHLARAYAAATQRNFLNDFCGGTLQAWYDLSNSALVAF
jgi:hypothetical protein